MICMRQKLKLLCLARIIWFLWTFVGPFQKVFVVESSLVRPSLKRTMWQLKQVNCRCVCVTAGHCVCVCLCSSTYWFLPASRHLWYRWDVRINDLLLWAFPGCFCQVPSSLSPNLSYFTSKDEKTSAVLLLERKQYDIMCSPKRWYIYWYRI